VPNSTVAPVVWLTPELKKHRFIKLVGSLVVVQATIQAVEEIAAVIAMLL
jgi:hypothetical protein